MIYSVVRRPNASSESVISTEIEDFSRGKDGYYNIWLRCGDTRKMSDRFEYRFNVDSKLRK